MTSFGRSCFVCDFVSVLFPKFCRTCYLLNLVLLWALEDSILKLTVKWALHLIFRDIGLVFFTMWLSSLIYGIVNLVQCMEAFCTRGAYLSVTLIFPLVELWNVQIGKEILSFRKIQIIGMFLISQLSDSANGYNYMLQDLLAAVPVHVSFHQTIILDH